MFNNKINIPNILNVDYNKTNLFKIYLFNINWGMIKSGIKLLRQQPQDLNELTPSYDNFEYVNVKLYDRSVSDNSYKCKE